MTRLDAHLQLPRCPHCNDEPSNLAEVSRLETADHSGLIKRKWKIYKCANCGGVVTAWAEDWGQEAIQIFPDSSSPDDAIPARPRTYLYQALESIHSPVGSVMLAAGAVDAMLRIKGYTEGSLYAKLQQAVKDHVITAEMETWAHELRIDGNDPQHADGHFPLPTVEDAKRSIELAQVYGQHIFCLPAKVQQGIANAGD